MIFCILSVKKMLWQQRFSSTASTAVWLFTMDPLTCLCIGVHCLILLSLQGFGTENWNTVHLYTKRNAIFRIYMFDLRYQSIV